MNIDELEIEDATYIPDISGLKLNWIKTIKQLNIVETENILKAYSKYFSMYFNKKVKWFTLPFLKKIHKEMFGKVWNWAGLFRKTTTNIGSKPHLISSEIELLCEDVEYWIKHSSFNLLEQNIRIHHRLVKIHPFINGNGRHARFVSDLYIYSNNGIPPQWPKDLFKECKNRKQYIKALKEADQGNYNKLYEFIISHGARNNNVKLKT